MRVRLQEKRFVKRHNTVEDLVRFAPLEHEAGVERQTVGMSATVSPDSVV